MISAAALAGWWSAQCFLLSVACISCRFCIFVWTTQSGMGCYIICCKLIQSKFQNMSLLPTSSSFVVVNIEIYNNSSLEVDITNYETSGTYTKQPQSIGTEGAEVEICVSIILTNYCHSRSWFHPFFYRHMQWMPTTL